MHAAELGWSEFYVAVAGAAAGLAGLIIVAMSVNIDRIMKSPSIPARAASAISALVLAVAACCLGLIPGQPAWLLGLELAVGSAVAWILWGYVVRDAAADAEPGRPAFPSYAIAFLAPATFSVGAVVLLTGSLGGLAWVAAGSVVAIVAGVVFAWIALVEVLR